MVYNLSLDIKSDKVNNQFLINNIEERRCVIMRESVLECGVCDGLRQTSGLVFATLYVCF